MDGYIITILSQETKSKTKQNKTKQNKDTYMIENLLTLIESLKTEVTKFEGGNKSAGTRARKILQDIKAEAQSTRLKIQEQKTSAVEAK